MKLVVEIDEVTYKDIKKGKIYSSIRDVPLESVNAIANGTPLPKGHGRIIDESQITGTFTWDNGFIECFAPTIIEAEESEDDRE